MNVSMLLTHAEDIDSDFTKFDKVIERYATSHESVKSIRDRLGPCIADYIHKNYEEFCDYATSRGK